MACPRSRHLGPRRAVREPPLQRQRSSVIPVQTGIQGGWECPLSLSLSKGLNGHGRLASALPFLRKQESKTPL